MKKKHPKNASKNAPKRFVKKIVANEKENKDAVTDCFEIMVPRKPKNYEEKKMRKKEKRSSPYVLTFRTGRDSATFWVKGTGVPSLTQDEGTPGQAKNLAKGGDSQNPGLDKGQSGTEQKDVL